jgi:DNA-binding NtrC family response regulator
MTPRGQMTRVISREGAEVRMMRTCVLEVVEGGARGTRVTIDRPVFRVGAHASCDLVLDDATVSQHHLELRAEPGGYRVIDLDSSNGTFVGGLRLGEALASEPLTLELGQTMLRLTPGAAERDEVELPASGRQRFGTLVGRSVAMRELFWQLEAAARVDSAVLLEGETGTGKERVAESLHLESPRASGPFVVVDCGALVGELMESELFGHVRGAFTGASADRRGLVESAHGGTLFLDEIGELPLPLQAKLLGVLERRRVQPVGGGELKPVDVRVIAATHRELAREVNRGGFRADLFYRVAVLRLRVPPLRERVDDIPLLVDEVLAELRARMGQQIPGALSSIAVARLQSQPWPGNVRELRNAIERAVAGLQPPTPVAVDDTTEPWVAARARARERFERAYFTELLVRSGGNVSQAARLAGLDRRYLSRMLDRLGMRAISS